MYTLIFLILAAGALARPQISYDHFVIRDQLLRQAQIANQPQGRQLSLEEPIKPVASPKISKKVLREEIDEDELLQNQNAKYEFSSDVEDNINDLTQHRQETRDGQTVKGVYSYSDGYYKITVNYIADKDGYRVTGMESVPLDVEGPQIDLKGTASIHNKAHGNELSYRIVGVQTTSTTAKLPLELLNKQRIHNFEI